MPTPRHSVSVAAAIVDKNNRILIIQRRDNGKWEPPGGVLELEESIPAGLAREVQEETGLMIEVERLTGIYKNTKLGVVALVFRASLIGGKPTTGDETAQIEWWDVDTIMQRSDPAFAVRLTDALRTDSPAIRSHDGVHVLD